MTSGLRRKGVLGLIPARAGSKGLPGKNLRPLLGKPLVGWAAEAGTGSKRIDDVVISSDDRAIIEVACRHGARAPFVRPAELSGDRDLVINVMLHALQWLEQNEQLAFEYVCLLQPTSPVTFPSDCDRAVELAFANDADTVISVYAAEHNPHFHFTLDGQGAASWLFGRPPSAMARRQDMPAVYARTGNVYLFRSRMLREERTLYGERLFAIEIPRDRGVTIDTEYDFAVAELQMNRYAGQF